jgi:hypothetical protein
MKSRTVSGRAAGHRRRPPAGARRSGLYLGMAAAGALLVHVLVGADPATSAAAHAPQSVSVAQRLGLTAHSASADVTQQLQPLQDLTATRSSRESARSAAQQAQAAANQAELDRRKAEAEAAARAAAAAAAAAAQQQASANGHVNSAAAAAAAGTAATKVAKISNTLGPVQPKTQAAANAIVSNVPGADAITIGGTRPDATEPNGHPAGLALDMMVQSNTALGQAIVNYCKAHWNELGLSYLIYQQRILMSPNGAWQAMEDRGSPTANHMDHVHVNLAR